MFRIMILILFISSLWYGFESSFKLSLEAKIVDPDTGRDLGVDWTGELWFQSPTVIKVYASSWKSVSLAFGAGMKLCWVAFKGYSKNEEATAFTIDSKGWLKTGVLCYTDSERFVFIVDRLKELI